MIPDNRMSHEFRAVTIVDYVNGFMEAYESVMRPLCEELKMPQTALDILLFLANNPEYYTAKDICTYRHLKPGIVSFHIEHMVKEGYLTREPVQEDRRKTKLKYTRKAEPIVSKGIHMQRTFTAAISQGLSQEEMDHFFVCLSMFHQNVELIKKEGFDNYKLQRMKQ